MSDHALFYNSVDHDRVYNADSFSDWLKKFFTTGVFTGDLFVSALSGMNVSVGTGYVNINGKVMIYETATQLTLEPANGIYPRIDTIVVERNDTDRDFYLKVVTGDYANLNDPVPTPPVRSGAIYQLVLAQIYVGAGVTEITQANITDTRADSTVCGIVTGTVTEMDFSQFVAQFNAYYEEFQDTYEADFDAWSLQKRNDFNTWELAQQAAFTAWMNGEKSDFDNWFANLHYVLDGDVAGHLQNEIDQIEEGLAGSIFTIHTTNTRLYGKTIMITGSTQTKSAVFDASGNAQITGITDVGNITFTATDGTDTATTVINVPYFSKYSVSMSFWSATVNLSTNCPEAYGKTITVKKGGAIIASVQFNAVGQATYIANSSGTYTFSVTVDGVIKTESISLTTDGQTASVAINFGEIDLTYDNEFKSGTITCSDGTTTITKTAPSSGNTMAFYPPTTGTWTISGTYSGHTYSKNAVVTDLSVPVSVQLQTTQSVSVTVYSAVGDTLSYTDIYGVSRMITLDNNSDHATATIDILPSGSTLTFTSSIAKNPNDLTADYSKSITITNATTEIKVMPDNALYWWGYENALFSGIVMTNYRASSAGGQQVMPTITRNTSDVQIAITGAATSSQGSAIINNVPLASASSLSVIGSCPKPGTYSGVSLNVASSATISADHYAVDLNEALDTTTSTKTINVSSISTDRAISFFGTYTTATIKALWLE